MDCDFYKYVTYLLHRVVVGVCVKWRKVAEIGQTIGLVQTISNLWVAGSSPAGRARNNNQPKGWFYLCCKPGREPVRQQVDFAKVMKRNRYGCPTGQRPRESCWARQKLNRPIGRLLFF